MLSGFTCIFFHYSARSETQRNPILPVELSGVLLLLAATRLPVAIAVVTKVGAASHHSACPFEGPRGSTIISSLG